MSQNSSWRHFMKSTVVGVSTVVEDSITSVKAYTKEAVEHLILAFIIYCLLCVLLYTGIVHWNVLDFSSEVRNTKRVLIVIAHPDDECMFFGPTVLNLTKEKNCQLYLMCLSTGKNYGMGKVRKNELYEACKVLGIDEGSIFVHNHTLLPDSMEAKWPIEVISELILQQIETYNINTLITFDKDGVSSHANHCHIYYAIAEMALEKRLPSACDVYVLESVNTFRKYWLFLDIPLCFILSRNRYILNWNDRNVVRDAMYRHSSQLRWYRKMYMAFSRYTLINTLQRLDVADLELELELDE